MSCFIQLGGVWLIGQGALLSAVGLLAIFLPGSEFHPVIILAGVVLILAGGSVAIAGAVALGKNLTPFPKPKDEGQLVRRGIYRWVRHPLYTSLILVSIGWALIWQSWPGFLAAMGLIPFLVAKSRREEVWLREKFPEYMDYERHVRRFFPWFR